MQSGSLAHVPLQVAAPPQKYGAHEGLPVQPDGAFVHVPLVAPVKPRVAPLHTSHAPALHAVSQQ
jgi:hypothetical protein